MAGIKDAYGEDVKVVLCHWHILKAWRQRVVKEVRVVSRVGGPSALERKAYRDGVMVQMIAMMQARTEAAFEDAYADFNDANSTPDDVWDSTGLIVYFDRYYLDKKENWSMAWRQSYVASYTCDFDVRTNNYVESWHRTLKEVYLQNLRTQRVDVLLYILMEIESSIPNLDLPT
ncbi:hypothetical protein [Absidia glauca]|uniref:MULE transposase domain-containing protein n=1 Tax=Absidia glauca TaxID=4829 RepID=A0A168ML27_ABSGL|nr:hypothetical protein [Absidia glauca]